MQDLVIYTDGACLGNPGPMGIGIVVQADGKIIRKESIPLERGTNNEAELTAMAVALERAVQLKESNITLKSDSEWAVKMANGEYNLKQERLRPLLDRVQKAMVKAQASVNWIPREENSQADYLSKQAAMERR